MEEDKKITISQLLNPQIQPQGPDSSLSSAGSQYIHHHRPQYTPHFHHPNPLWNHQQTHYQTYAQSSHSFPEPLPSTTLTPDTMSSTYTNINYSHQTAERASVRLVAKTTATAFEQQLWSGPSSSGDVRDPYPPEHDQPSQPLPEQVTQKRKRSTSRLNEELEGGQTSSEENVTKKSRKVPSTGSVNRPSSSSSTSSKRGFSAKKRNEAAQMAAVPVSVPPVSYTVNSMNKSIANVIASPTSELLAPLSAEVQSTRCMSSRYKNYNFPRCVSCTRRWAGDTCRFQGVRIFMKDDRGDTVGVAYTNRQHEETPIMHFLDVWNEEFGWEELRRTKVVAAKALLPVLKREQEHTAVDSIIYRRRECDVRATCDTCMTSLFCCTWMCRGCGREACSECYAEIKELTRQGSDMTPAERAEQKKAKEKQMHSKPFFLACTKRNEHDWNAFTPVSRFCRQELEGAIEGMQKLIDEVESAQDDKALLHLEQEYEPTPFRYPPVPPPTSILSLTEPPVFPVNPITSIPDQIPSHPISRFTKPGLSFPIFRDHWRKGVPLVVEGLLPDFRINWTPEYFVEKYGNQTCLVVECQTEENKRVTVGQFFKTFRTSGLNGSERESRESLGPGTWKLKDWPPSTDFKTAFPELYEDFSQAVPIPQYVRRDGVMNIASHFPRNTVAPDLGPKMYNAMTASEEPGSKGSTRLHMDMADALNIMTYASPIFPPSASSESSSDSADVTSAPNFPAHVESGCAAWDLFRAEDANKLRTFLKRKFPKQSVDDPIHSQQVYLDRELRKQLFDEEGVMSYRVYQRPGEAVFVPAGVAHQVCNLSDCIKVAIDFVSPENVERCEQLTREFREQNHAKVWKEDVLQLRSMMWFAWLSCCRQEKKNASTQTPNVSQP